KPAASTLYYPVAESRPRYPARKIDINTADIAAFESLYGIGSKLATRIVNFRDKLGGFCSVEQVGETYGLPDSTFQKIKPQLEVNAALTRQININAAGYEELNNHPYINAKTAFHILKYRKEKGDFSTIEVIRELVQANDQFEKIAPYIKTD